MFMRWLNTYAAHTYSKGRMHATSVATPGEGRQATRWSGSAASEGAAWDFACEAVRGLQDQLGLTVASQID